MNFADISAVAFGMCFRGFSYDHTVYLGASDAAF